MKDLDRPPRWAEALLRVFLSPSEGETESGDLLEAYRDSILPGRGRWRAHVWYVRQVAGYILRARVLNVRSGIFVGLTLCILTTAFSIIRYPSLLAETNAPKILVAVAFGFFLYGYIALKWARPSTAEEAVALRLGTKWGLAIGMLWIASSVSGNLVSPHGFGASSGMALALIAFLLPFASGAHAVFETGKAHAGLTVGFWGGIISGLMAFLAAAGIGYLTAFVPGFPGAEIPPAGHAYGVMEYQALNVGDGLGGAFAMLFLICGVLAVISGTVGGVVGCFLRSNEPTHDVSVPK